MTVVPTAIDTGGLDLTGLSYATLDEADIYFAFRLNSAAWDDASNDDKCKAIVTATRAIDRLNFAGLRTSDYTRFSNANISAGYVFGPEVLDPSADTPSPGQALEFPRNGATTIPEDIKNACCEIALALLDGVDPEQEMRGLGSTSQRFAAASVTFDPESARMAIRHGIPSHLAWTWLLPYLADPLEINTKRVS